MEDQQAQHANTTTPLIGPDPNAEAMRFMTSMPWGGFFGAQRIDFEPSDFPVITEPGISTKAMLTAMMLQGILASPVFSKMCDFAQAGYEGHPSERHWRAIENMATLLVDVADTIAERIIDNNTPETP